MKIPSFYVIESNHNIQEKEKFRFRSLYNGTLGSWNYTRKEAVQEGEDHEKIVRFLCITRATVEKGCWNCGARKACCHIDDDMIPCKFWYFG